MAEQKKTTTNLTISLSLSLYEEVRRAALHDSVDADRVISVSEWAREALIERLQRQRKK